MTSRDAESALLDRCAQAADGCLQSAEDQREANVFRLASMILHSKYSRESSNLMQASERYFADHPSEKLDPAESVRNGWVFSLPRLRDMICNKLNEKKQYARKSHISHPNSPG